MSLPSSELKSKTSRKAAETVTNYRYKILFYIQWSKLATDCKRPSGKEATVCMS
jgi:hypothetical protein